MRKSECWSTSLLEHRLLFWRGWVVLICFSTAGSGNLHYWPQFFSPVCTQIFTMWLPLVSKLNRGDGERILSPGLGRGLAVSTYSLAPLSGHGKSFLRWLLSPELGSDWMHVEQIWAQTSVKSSTQMDPGLGAAWPSQSQDSQAR